MKDALDRVWKPFGKKEKQAFAKMKAEQEWQQTIEDPHKLRVNARAYERTVQAQRKAAGLDG